MTGALIIALAILVIVVTAVCWLVGVGVFEVRCAWTRLAEWWRENRSYKWP